MHVRLQHQAASRNGPPMRRRAIEALKVLPGRERVSLSEGAANGAEGAGPLAVHLRRSTVPDHNRSSVLGLADR